jgi:hypothetical protein
MRSSFPRAACKLIANTLILAAGCAISSPSSAGAQQPTSMSAASTAPVVLPTTLKFSRDSIRAIQDGSKIATVRKGVRTFPAGLIKAVCNNVPPIVLQNVVTTPKKFTDLTEADAKANGSESLDELKDDLQRDYPGIQPGDMVTVITFRVAPVNPSN